MVHLVVPGLSIGCVFSILGYSVLVVFYVGGVLHVMRVWSMYFKPTSILI
jgi:hypothetical protein